MRQHVLGGMLAFGVGSSCFVVGAVSAEEQLPSETTNVVTHAGPGGGADITARMMTLRGRRELDRDIGRGQQARRQRRRRPAIPQGRRVRRAHHHDPHPVAHPADRAEQGAGHHRGVVGLARATLDPQIITVRADSETLDHLIEKSKGTEGGLK